MSNPRERSKREYRLSDNEEEDVIEAARALFRGYTVEDSSADAWRCDDVLDHRLHDLFLKVEALDKAEVGDE